MESDDRSNFCDPDIMPEGELSSILQMRPKGFVKGIVEELEGRIETSVGDNNLKQYGVNEIKQYVAFARSSSMNFKKTPVIIFTIGIAGAGKTSFIHKLLDEMQDLGNRAAVLNLDPHKLTLSVDANADVKGTLGSKKDMKINEVMLFIRKKARQLDYVFVDTPGQIDVVSESACGPIIAKAFASCFPTVITFVVDAVCSSFTYTFMKTMIYLGHLKGKIGPLPVVLVFTKTDIDPDLRSLEWVEDARSFVLALIRDCEWLMPTASEFLRMGFFYRDLSIVGVSAITGTGMDALLKVLEASVEEFMATYRRLAEDNTDSMKDEREYDVFKYFVSVGARSFAYKPLEGSIYIVEVEDKKSWKIKREVFKF